MQVISVIAAHKRIYEMSCPKCYKCENTANNRSSPDVVNFSSDDHCVY